MIIAILILFGLCFGSFTNALVWRLREQSLPAAKRQSKGKAHKKDLSISKGRSMCVSCGHALHARDLVPVLSWLILKGRCRYCKQAISWQYPLVELATALIFVVSYLLWPRDVVGWEVAALGLWLTTLVGFMALVIYDLRWMLLPNKIVFPLYAIAALYVGARILSESNFDPLLSSFWGILVGGGIFYILFQVSNGKWIGGGDVKLGFLLGALVGGPLEASLMLFIASFAGTLATLPLAATGKMKRNTRIPFGPLLIFGAIVVMLVGTAVIDWYKTQILNV